ncbi:MAG TPA: TetR family transcriptional regulator [Candidatus Polarisedimenticolia bacterium]|nr:TetR family transcriptional regulator [Candidatus Polarisedimenticolia bacterium]
MKRASPSRRSPADTRHALLAAGTRLFAERGFDGASVEAIARLAKANKAMISYYFGGKEGLYRTILAETFEPVLKKMEALRQVSRPAPELLQAFIFYFAEMVEHHPDLPAMLLREVLSGGRHLDAKALHYFLSLFAAVREILEAGVRQKSFRAVDPFLTHLSVIGGLVFFFATHPLRERLAREGRLPVKLPKPDAYVHHFALLMTRALKREGAAPASWIRR